MKTSRCRLLAFHALLALAASANPRLATAEQIEVLLFGQPCQLQGPTGQFTETQLRWIHQASPEQTPITATPGTLKGSLERLQAATALPSEFQHYREVRLKLLSNRLKFEEAVVQAHKNGNVQVFTSATRELIHPRRHAELVKKLQAALKAGPSPRSWEEVQEYFIEFAGSDGEEDFHRTLRRLKIRYHCSFEEERGEEEAAKPEGTPQTTGAKKSGA